MIKRIIKGLVPYRLGVWLRNQQQKVNGIYFKGNKYYCPYCKHSFRKLLPAGSDFEVLKSKQVIGAGFRENALCPRCFSTDRDRLIYLLFREKPELLKDGNRVLHLAPEKSIKAYLQKNKKLDYTAGDKFEEEYTSFYYDQDVIYMDLLKLKADSESFDGIICNHVLEHIDDEEVAINEISRVLKIGGWALLQVPYSNNSEKTLEMETNSPKEREELFGQFDHVRLYGLDYPEILRKNGLSVDVIEFNKLLTQDELDRYAVNKEEKIFLAGKK
jgi:SAM-dependent methyltransferase